jgi:hypothetical protein
MKLSMEQQAILQAMAGGSMLKAHRYLDGRKVYRLHGLDGQSRPVRAATVQALAELRLIDSNKKFPAASFWLTPAGRVALKGALALDGD